MYIEEKNLQEQVNALSEELRNVKMQLQALYKHLNIHVSPKREIITYEVNQYNIGLTGLGTVQSEQSRN